MALVHIPISRVCISVVYRNSEWIICISRTIKRMISMSIGCVWRKRDKTIYQILKKGIKEKHQAKGSNIFLCKKICN